MITNVLRLLNKSIRRPERITVNDLVSMIERGEIVSLLDVRTQEEYLEGHIPGSIFITPQNLSCMEDHSIEGKKVLYCTAGVRSYRACLALAARGIHTFDLIGGIKAWEEAGGVIEIDQQTDVPEVAAKNLSSGN